MNFLLQVKLGNNISAEDFRLYCNVMNGSPVISKTGKEFIPLQICVYFGSYFREFTI